MIKLFRTLSGFAIEHEGKWYSSEGTSLSDTNWNLLITRDDLHETLRKAAHSMKVVNSGPTDIVAPIGSQEVWAAGVTYFRSRDARMEESKSAGGGDFYDRLYSAERPELFFKGSAHRVVGYGRKVAIRSDALWSVPEPELTLLIS